MARRRAGVLTRLGSCEISQLRDDIFDELLDETRSLAPAAIAVGKGEAGRNW